MNLPWRLSSLWTVLVGLAPLALAACSDGGASDFQWGRMPSFSPDGDTVVYARVLSSPSDSLNVTLSGLDVGELYRIGIDGRNDVQLTPDGRGPDFHPRVSPDGTQMTFVSGEGGQFDVWVADLAGGARRPLTFDRAPDTTPSWSPDGSRIYFASDRSGNSDLWSVSVSGGGLQQVTSFPSDEAFPALSPDGTRIAFVSNRDRGNFDVWVMDLDGSNLRQLTRKEQDGSNTADGSPAWSPDGQTLAFERWDSNWDIWRIDADGQNLVQLTTHKEHDGDPVYSPDGQTIAFTSARTKWWQVWLMNADGTNMRLLTGQEQ